MSQHHTNIIRIKAVSAALSYLNEKVVFVGGATVSLYADRTVFEVRPTDDIDVLIEILNYVNRTELESRLREVGFLHDTESSIVCRFKIHGITVDIMPTKDASIGFNRKWHAEGFEKALNFNIDESCTINLLSAPYFIASKLEAFKDRGENDGRTSKDFEDIIFVLENRKVIWEEMNILQGKIKEYLQYEFTQLLKNPNISEWIDGHVERGSPPATRLIMEEMKKFA